MKCRVVDERTEGVFDVRDRAKEEEPLQLDDARLFGHFVDVCAVSCWTADGGDCAVPRVACSNAAPVGVLNDKEETWDMP